MSDLEQALNHAIEAAGGTRAALAKKIGVTRQAIHSWRKVPAERLWDVSRATGIPIEALRPDLKIGATE